MNKSAHVQVNKSAAHVQVNKSAAHVQVNKSVAHVQVNISGERKQFKRNLSIHLQIYSPL